MAQGITIGDARCREYMTATTSLIGGETGIAQGEAGQGIACQVTIGSKPRFNDDQRKRECEFINEVNGTLTIEIYEGYTQDLLLSRKEHISTENTKLR